MAASDPYDRRVKELLQRLSKAVLADRPEDVAGFIAEKVKSLHEDILQSEQKQPLPAPAAPTAPTPPQAPVTPKIAPLTRKFSISVRNTERPDGVAAASKVVGGTIDRPSVSVDADTLLDEMEKEGKLVVLKGVACNVPYKATIVLPEGKDSRDVENIMQGVFREVQSTFSHFDPDSEVSTINNLKANAIHVPSAAMNDVLSTVLKMFQISKGAFDPGVLPLIQASKNGASQDELAEVTTYASWSRFTFQPGVLFKDHDLAALDLCGMAKGWALDEMADRLEGMGCTSAYLDWGGDIKVVGFHPAGRRWTVIVPTPPPIADIGTFDPEHAEPLARFDLQPGTSLAVSGDYEQTLGGSHCHILDAKKKRLVALADENLGCVGVASASGMVADALATAASAINDMKQSRQMLDGLRGAVLKDHFVQDYLLYSRHGPRMTRARHPGMEAEAARESRLKLHSSAHVVVVGGGLAGLSATIQAAHCGARVTLVEKEAKVGGNSAKATSGINGWGTRSQHSQGVGDEAKYFERDTYLSGMGGTTDTGLVHNLSFKSASAIHWLMDVIGIPLTSLTQLGGHSKKRTHRVPPRPDGTPVPVGFTIMRKCEEYIQTHLSDKVTLRTGCLCDRLLSANREVLGVEIVTPEGTKEEIRADATIITTGGFGYDQSMESLLREFRPDLLGVPTTCGPWTDGSGIKLGRDIGALLVDMDKVQLHPTAFIDPKNPSSNTKYLGPEALRGSGGILLDQSGRRFVNELDLRSVVSQAMLEKCEKYPTEDGSGRPFAWCLLNQDMQEKFGRPQLTFYKDRMGLFEGASDLTEAAKVIGCDPGVLHKTVERYTGACNLSYCADTGKAVFPSLLTTGDTDLILARVTPCIHYCMGGLNISASTEVQEAAEGGALGKRKPIPRLFAAGECTGGLHGANRLGGNSLLECVVMGRTAGERAATIVQPANTCLGDRFEPLILREVRATDEKYGKSTRVYRFNLHGSLQTTGLAVGQFIAMKAQLDGETLQGYFSPITRPDDVGVIDVLCRTDPQGGAIVEYLNTLTPGSECYLKAMGGLRLEQSGLEWYYKGRRVRRISMMAGGTGIAPMLQIIRSYMHSTIPQPDLSGNENGLRLVYAAEESQHLAFADGLSRIQSKRPELFQFHLVLNNPPVGWTQGVGFIDRDIIRSHLWFPPADDQLVVVCGPPIFEKFMCSHLAALGYPRHTYFAYSQQED